MNPSLPKDSNWSDIGNLPSNFYPYTYSSLDIQPLTLKQLKLLSKTTLTGDLNYQFEAVASCISTDVLSLSIGDYYYILEWLKYHSMPKTPLTVEWTCPHKILQHKETGDMLSNHPESLRQSAATINPADYDLVDCNTLNTEIVHFSSLEVFQLPEENWTGLPDGFDFPRVSHLIDLKEALKDPELNMIIPAAQWVKAATVAEKLAILEAQPNLSMFHMGLSLNRNIKHGIATNTTLHCRACSAEYKYTIQVEAASFFQ